MRFRGTILMLLFIGISSLSFSQAGFGESEKINNNWKFILNDVSEAKEPSFNDRRWQNVDLPHDWSVKQQLSPTLASATGYLPGGIGWYRKTVDIPQDKVNEKVYL